MNVGEWRVMQGRAGLAVVRERARDFLKEGGKQGGRKARSGIGRYKTRWGEGMRVRKSRSGVGR